MLYNANLAYAVTLGGANDGGESSLVVNRVVLFVAVGGRAAAAAAYAIRAEVAVCYNQSASCGRGYVCF